MTTINTETPETSMRILKVATTSSLSSRSTLGYAIGCDETGAIHLSLRSNTAAGMFSKNWVSFADLNELLSHADKISSSTLTPLYLGTSRNNAGFMLAVLIGEGLVSPAVNKDRSYSRLDFHSFLTDIHALIESGVSLEETIETPAIETAVAPVIGKRGRPKKTLTAHTVSH